MTTQGFKGLLAHRYVDLNCLNIMDSPDEIKKIELEEETLVDLDKTRKWTMFLAILGFIGIGVLLIVGIFTGVFLSVFNKGNTATSFPGWLVCIIIIAASAVYFFPMLYIFRFSKLLSGVSRNPDKENLKKAFKNLRAYFTYMGIFLIVVLVMYIIALLLMGSSLSFPGGSG
jgi:Na+/melibiose symporter-like transporter